MARKHYKRTRPIALSVLGRAKRICPLVPETEREMYGSLKSPNSQSRGSEQKGEKRDYEQKEGRKVKSKRGRGRRRRKRRE